MAYEGAGEEAPGAPGEARGGAGQGAARQPEEADEPHPRARRVPECGRQRLSCFSFFIRTHEKKIRFFLYYSNILYYYYEIYLYLQYFFLQNLFKSIYSILLVYNLEYIRMPSGGRAQALGWKDVVVILFNGRRNNNVGAKFFILYYLLCVR